MNLRYKINTIGRVTKIVASPTWNTKDIVMIKTNIVGWYNALSPELQFDEKNMNVFLGKKYGSFTGLHIVNLCWRTVKGVNGQPVFKFFADVQLRGSRQILPLIDVVERDAVTFSIENWGEHFVVTAKKDYVPDSNVYLQIPKNGENSWTWMGGSIVEPQWNSTSTLPSRDVLLYIQVD